MSVQTSRSATAEFQQASVRLTGVAGTDRTRTPREAWLIVALLFTSAGLMAPYVMSSVIEKGRRRSTASTPASKSAASSC